MAATISRSSLLRLAALKTSPATLYLATGLSIRRLQSTFASTSYNNILVDVVGTNKDISLITLNRPKAVGRPRILLARAELQGTSTLTILSFPCILPFIE